jgi:hypothetical protein
MRQLMSMNVSSRRDFLKKTAYVAPLVLTMNVSLAAAQVGSARQAPSGDTIIQASDGGSSNERRSYRGRGRAHGRRRRDDDDRNDHHRDDD